METDMFLILFYIAALQVVALIGIIILAKKKSVAIPIQPVEQSNPEKVKVMVHYENGEIRLKDGVIIEGNMWKALAGKECAYLQANGDKYRIHKDSSFKDNTFHVWDKTKVKVAPSPQGPIPSPQETKPQLKLSAEEVQELYQKVKGLPSEKAQEIINNYLKAHTEVKP